MAPGRFPFAGFGLGLRTAHYTEIDGTRPQTSGIDWFEILTEN